MPTGPDRKLVLEELEPRIAPSALGGVDDTSAQSSPGVGPGGVVEGASAPLGSPPASPRIDYVDMLPEQPQETDPATIWYDDFDVGNPQDLYYEYGNDGGDFVPVSYEQYGSTGRALRARFQQGEVGAGGVKVFYGANPAATGGKMHLVRRPGEHFDEVYWRVYLKHESGWVGNPAKLSRTTILAGANWSQAMIAHNWGGQGNLLCLDPASGVENGQVVTTGYNDFTNLHWLGIRNGTYPIFATEESGHWVAVESYVKLNTPGLQDGEFAFWIDGKLEARATGLNWVDTWNVYGLNATFLENYWNSGSVRDQERYFDNFVISTEPIGPVVVPTNPVIVKTPFADPDSGDAQQAWQVQVASDPSGTDLVWDSGVMADPGDQVVVNTQNGSFLGGAAGRADLVADQVHWVRVRQQDNTGSWSPWSDWHAAFKTGAGSSAVADIAVTDSQAPYDDLVLDLGSIRNDGAGGATATGTVTITNAGVTDLIVTGLALADGTDFALSGAAALPFALASGSSQDITITFDPVRTGALNDTLTISSNDPDEGTVGLSLSGVGVVPDIAVTDSAGPADDLALDLGYVRSDGPGGAAATGTVTLTNTGAYELTVTDVSLADGGNFSVGGLPARPFALVPGASQDVTVSFDPLGMGPVTDTLTIASDDPDQGTVSVALSGTGGVPDIAVFDAEAPSDDLAMNLGDTAADGPDGAMVLGEVTIVNQGTYDLTVTDLGLSTGWHFGIAGSPATPFVLAPSAQASVQVSFDPRVSGTFADTLTIVSDDPDEGVLQVSLTGHGFFTHSWQNAGATVTVYDLWGPVDVNPNDVQVKFGPGNSVSAVKLRGQQSMDGLAIAITGASSVGSIKDARRGPLGDLAFIASTAPVRTLALRGSIEGFNLNGWDLGGLTFGNDLDGDGDQTEHTALWIDGGLRVARLAGPVAADVLIGGPLRTLRSRSSVLGDVKIDGDAKNLAVQGDLGHIGSSVHIGGSLGGLKVASRTTSADLLADVRVDGEARSIVVGAGRSGGKVVGDIDVGGSLRTFSVAEDSRGRVTINGDLRKAKVGGDLGSAGQGFEVAGDLRHLTVGSRLSPADLLADLVVSGSTGRFTVYGDVRGPVTVGGDLTALTTGLICDTITVGGNLSKLTTASVLVPGAGPGDFICINPGVEPPGSLTVAGTIGRVRTV